MEGAALIEFLRGKIIHKEDEHVVLDVAGVGYGLDLPVHTARSLPAQGEEAELAVFTNMNGNDGSLQLFGFENRAQRDIFEVFLGISGVGPRLALAVLSTFAAEELIQIVLAGDARALKAVPGVGLKKAEKLLLELKGRVDRLSAGIDPAKVLANGNAPTAGSSELAPLGDAARDAAAALSALDLSPVAARQAVVKAIEALGPDATTSDLVREGLKHRR